MTRDLKLVGASLLLWGIGESFFRYFQPLYLEKLGADPLVIGGLLGLAALVMTLTHLPAGILTDQLGRKRFLTVGLMFGTLSAALMFLADNLTVFVIGMLFYGLTGFVVVPLNSYITAVRGSLSVTRALTLISALFNLGGFIGAWVGGMVSQAIGLRSVYGIASAFFLLSFGLILFVRKQPHEPIALNQRYNALFKNKVLGRFLLLACIAMFGMYLGWPLTPNFLQNERLVSLGAIGVFGSMHGLGVVLLNLSLGRLLPSTGFLLAQFAVGCSTILLCCGSGLPFYAMGYFLAGGHRLSWSLVNAQVEGLVNKSELGLTFGFVETTFGIVRICAPPIAGYLYNVTPDLPYKISFVIIGLSLILTLAFAPRIKPKSLPQNADPA